MGPPTVTQRIDQLEEKAAGIEEKMMEMVANAVGRAMEAMRHTLDELVIEGQNTTTKKLGADLDAMAVRLEGRISRSREYQEALINTMRNNQVKFQTEIKSTLTGLSTSPVLSVDKAEGSSNHPGSATIGMIPTPLIRDEPGKGTGSGFITRGSGGGPGNWHYRKLDMPIFDRNDPDGWILRVERYFAFYRLTEEEMLEAVAVALDGDALRWYQWENKRHPIRRWVDLKGFIL